ncbi:MAG TPA: trypsin-like peptidase domain-containing protein [Candidatus Acidoferrales bacterium]|nr:trypsin-like peptidase domain-containing protein [Candidatus Acidoferrales bacterium]
MHPTRMRILLLNLGSISSEAVNAALAGQGYEITTENGLTVEQVLTLQPEVVVTEATPSDLSCCGLVTQLKSQPDAGSLLKVVMIVHGGALERARGLDLGTDDVISFPFDASEFAARIRTQFRERRPEEELQTMLKEAVKREHYADLAVESLSGGAVNKRRFWLIPAILAFSAAAVLAVVFLGISTRSSRKETLELRAEVARLNGRLPAQGELLRRAEETRGSIEADSRSASATRDSLKAQSADLRKKVAASDGAEADSLKRQLTETENRLALLEKENTFAENVIHKYGPSVCLLHVVVEFREKSSGNPIQVTVDASGKPQVDDKGMVQLQVGGNGPHLQIDGFGTGFLAARDGTIFTNHHVAEPWWNDDDVKQLLDRGAEAYVVSYQAYFPEESAGIPANLGQISSKADVATLKLEAPAPPDAVPLTLDDRSEASVRGEPVVLIGYPTGVEGILAKADSDVAQKIADGTQNLSQLMSQVAAQHLIRPTTTQGHIGDVLPDKIVYDAATTSGGSGGPVFNQNGKVIGINFAILKDFGGSNLAVPARYAKDLLKQSEAAK